MQGMVETNQMETNMMTLQNDYHGDIRTTRQPSAPSFARRLFSGALIFSAAYFVTISVNAGQANTAPANPPDVIQLNADAPGVVTGTVVEADEEHIIINSAGRQMRINLEDVDLQNDAGTVFAIGMDVTVEGEMQGEDFGMPVMLARSVTAREAAQKSK